MNSLMMSACVVPDRCCQGMPRSSATTRNIASRIQAVGLIVIETEIEPMSILPGDAPPSGDPENHRQQDPGGGVDPHRARDRADVDPVEEAVQVLDVVDRD